MDTFEKISQVVKDRFYFKEILYLTQGMVFLFILNLFFKFDIENIPNFQSVTPNEKFIILIILSYFLARICREMGKFFVYLIYFVIKKNRKKRLIKKFSNFFEQINSETYFSKTDLRHYPEVLEALKDSTQITSDYMDKDIIYFIATSFLGISIIIIVMSWFIHPVLAIKYLYLIFIVLGIFACTSHFSRTEAMRRLADMCDRKSK
ncbi:MAG: hypothetical protein WC609_02095 [Candidatus Paceibacterota bacterium]|jgi:hypothetical protein